MVEASSVDHKTSEQKCFGTEEIAKVIGSDPIEIMEIVAKYRKTLTDHSAQIHGAIAESDQNTIAILSHRLKSSSRAMEANVLADCCEEMEQFDGLIDGQKFQALADRFDVSVTAVLEAIDAHLIDASN